FEQMMKRLDLRIPHQGDTLRFDVERVTIEPFDLRQPCKYDVVVDRLTHWYATSREWIKKSIVMNDLYVFNNPWSIQSNEKQTSVEGFDLFVRCIGFGPQTRCVLYDPSAPLHDRYTMKTDFMPAADVEHLRKVTLTINAFFGWDFNSCEALRQRHTWVPIDFANPCPDSQVTSLHFHFPWLVKAYLRWTIFCAATKRRMRRNLDWEPFYQVAAMDLPYSEKLDRYAAIARERFESDRFDEFCSKHLAHLDEVTSEF